MVSVLGVAIPAAPIVSLGVTGDNRRAYGLRADGVLDAWDLQSGSLGHDPSRKFIALDSGGRWAVAPGPSQGPAPLKRGNGFELWDLSKQRRMASLKMSWEYPALAVSPRVIVGGLLESLPAMIVWDWSAGKSDMQLGGQVPCGTFAVSSDGKRALCAANSAVGLWDLDKRELIRTLPQKLGVIDGQPLAISMLCFAADGREALVFATGARYSENDLRVWDLTTGDSHPGPKVGREPFSRMFVSPDGHYVAMLDASDGVSLFDLRSRERSAKIAIEGIKITAGAFLLDGTLITGDDTGAIRSWDPAKRAELRSSRQNVGHTAAVSALSVSREGSRLLSAGDDGTARLWEPGSDRQLLKLTLGGGVAEATAMITPDGAHGVTSLGGGSIVDLATGRVVTKLGASPDAARVKAISPDGSTVLVETTLRDLQNGRARWTSPDIGFAAVFSPDQRWIYSLRERQVHVIDAATGARQTTLGDSGRYASGGGGTLAISPKGDFAIQTLEHEPLKLSGSYDVVARLDLPDGKRAWTIPLRKYARSIAIAADGRVAAVAGSPHLIPNKDAWPATVDILDTRTGARIDGVDLASSGATARCVAFSSDGRFLFVGLSSGAILKFAVAS